MAKNEGLDEENQIDEETSVLNTENLDRNIGTDAPTVKRKVLAIGFKQIEKESKENETKVEEPKLDLERRGAFPKEVIRDEEGYLTRTKIMTFHKEDWARLGKELMQLEEKCFVPDLQLEEKDKRAVMTSKHTIALIAMFDGKTIGEAYGVPYNVVEKEEQDNEDEEKHSFDELSKHYKDAKISTSKVFYNHSFAVLPEYQRHGIGTKLKEELIARAKQAGYQFFVNHAKEGTSQNIDLREGAVEIGECRNWYNTGKSHFVCEIDLTK
ncbi:MAG: GNAT family N-acetyltransferase [Candidatus Micrarchaeales archaeon]